MRLNPQSKLIDMVETDAIIPAIGIWFSVFEMLIKIDTSSETGSSTYAYLFSIHGFDSLLARFAIQFGCRRCVQE